ncbi:uncharacterized protein LOC129236780 [Anastrepha obliqua]|uniref:uncharacterized protein LOC129236780 n=1 Tax=Anastrepha obliqua TaxID=95512 RepID=UPI00240905B6|nr:uncharacterized protein LOC129236780 [Anastrepha obliqua]
MSKVLTQQNALPSQQSKKNENKKKTTPSVKTLNNNSSGINGSTNMRGPASSSLMCSSESPSTSSSPTTVDFDEFTSSSILEFLAREQECCTEADAESIFQEVSRLADNSDTRSVDEILREAELLMQQQSLYGNTDKTDKAKQNTKNSSSKMGKTNLPQSQQSLQFEQKQKTLPPSNSQNTQPLPVKMQSIKLNSKYTKHIENVCPSEIQTQVVSRTRLTNGNCSYQEIMQLQKNLTPNSAYAAPPIADTTPTPIAATTPQTPTPTAATPIGNQRFDVFVENLPSVSVISEESTPKDMQNMNATETDITTMALINGDDDDTDTV